MISFDKMKSTVKMLTRSNRIYTTIKKGLCWLRPFLCLGDDILGGNNSSSNTLSGLSCPQLMYLLNLKNRAVTRCKTKTTNFTDFLRF